jgi:hypothetical protein
MFVKKTIALYSIIAFIGTSLYAKEQDPDMISYKDYKEKKVSYNTSTKKVNNEKKIVSSPKKVEKKPEKKFASKEFLKKGTLINTNKYENIKYTDLYRIENKVYRISRKTNEILAVLN